MLRCALLYYTAVQGLRPAPKRLLRRALAAQADAEDDPLLQYLVLRRDLQEKESWPLGALVAQGAHAAAAFGGELI